MTREIIPFTTEEAWKAERQKDLTSTQISALFNVSPYETAFSLWHKKRGNIAESNEENERTRWGKRLQDAIAEGVLRDKGWQGMPRTEYIRLRDVRVGSSFDWIAYDSAVNGYADGGPLLEPSWLLEVKNVDGLAFKRGWVETDFGIEAPAHIELQLQHQLGVSGLREGYIAALVGGNRVELLHREFDEIVWQRILDLAAWFWSLKEAPPPDYARDYDVISRLHGYSSAGKVIEATSDVEELMEAYKVAARESQIWDVEKKKAKAKILQKIGDAERVEGLSYNLSAKEIGEVEIAAYVRKSYRDFRISERKA